MRRIAGPYRYTRGMPVARPPLGGISADTFLRDHWQQRPLVVRQALPGFAGTLDKRALLSIAAIDGVESRLVERGRGASGWRVTPGPLKRSSLARLPRRNWTVLINGLNLHSAAADALLHKFAFASWARLDDVMVSYAEDGGGVGPHVDSYDVFLLQGFGRRRWRLAPPRGAADPFRLLSNAPLKLIADFRPSEEHVLDAGDMLYLPPGWGHDGTALGPCTTYSIGFRAPRSAELSAAFLDFLHERGFPDSEYCDAARRATRHPSRIDSRLVAYAAAALGRIRWNRNDVTQFLGAYLSEPRPEAVFAPPARTLGRTAFMRRLGRANVVLDPRTRFLSRGAWFFINGERFSTAVMTRPALLELADSRRVSGRMLARARVGDLVFHWYKLGYLSLQ